MNNSLQNMHSQPLKSIRYLTLLAYILYFLGTVSLGTFSIIGLILAYIRRKDVQDTIFYSHLSRLIHTFWIFEAIQIIGFILIMTKSILVIIGIIILIIGYLWYLYRLISGFTKLSDNKAI